MFVSTKLGIQIIIDMYRMWAKYSAIGFMGFAFLSSDRVRDEYKLRQA